MLSGEDQSKFERESLCQPHEEDSISSPPPLLGEATTKNVESARRSAATIGIDPHHKNKYVELFHEIQSAHQENSGSVYSMSLPPPFKPKANKWRAIQPVLFVYLLLLLWISLFDSLYTGSNQSARDFTNIFCSLLLLVCTALVFVRCFSLIEELATLILLSTSLVRLGNFLLLIAVCFFPSDTYWALHFASLIIVTVGLLLFCVSTMVDGSAMQIVGSVLLAMGLSVNTVAFLILPDKTAFAAVELAGSVVTFVGCAIMGIRLMLDLEFPLFKPRNYLAWGNLLYGMGAFTMIWPNANILSQGTIVVNPQTNVFAACLFLLGSDLLNLFSFRRFILLDKVIEDRYPSTTMLANTRFSSLINFQATRVLLCPGIFIALIGAIFVDDEDTAFYIEFGGFLLVTIGFTMMTINMSLLRKPPIGVVLSILIFCVSLYVFIFALVVTINDFQTGQYISLVAMFVSLFSSVSLAVQVFRKFRVRFPATRKRNSLLRAYWFFFHPGNYLHLAFGCLIPLWALLRILGNFADLGMIPRAPSTTFHASMPYYQLGMYFFAHAAIVLLSHFRMALSSVKSVNTDFEKISEYLLTTNKASSFTSGKDALVSDLEDIQADIEVDVFVSGAGPCGLTLANELGIREVRTMVVEQRMDCIPDARFIMLNGNTCEGLESIDVLPKIQSFLKTQGLNEEFPFGAMWLNGVLQPDAQCVAAACAPSRFELMKTMHDKDLTLACARLTASCHTTQMPIRLMQSQQEQVLRKCAEEYVSNDIRYGHSLVEFQQRRKGDILCTVVNLTTNAVMRVSTKYLVSAEGPSSAISSKLGVEFDGFINLAKTKSTLFCAPGLWEKLARRFGMAHQYQITRNNMVLALVCVDPVRGLWNIPLMFPRGAAVSEEQELANLKMILGDPDQEVEICASTPWNLNFFIAKSFQIGSNVFLCGDAAHSWPPFGGLGGNSAFGDAHNLGWKLAACVQGWGGPALLESYSTERRQHILRTALYVKSIIPQPPRLLMVGNLLQRFPWTAPFWRLKFLLANSSIHNSNHFAQEGVQLGIRYELSQVVTDSIMTPDDPACHYEPRVSNGARLPVFIFNHGMVSSSVVERTGFTLLDFSHQNPSFVNGLLQKFAHYGVPVKHICVDGPIQDWSKEGVYSVEKLYAGVELCLVRPDRIVVWHARQHEPELDDQGVENLLQVVCGRKEHQHFHARVSFDIWLQKEFHYHMRALENSFPLAVRVKNQTKADAILQVKQKTNEDVSISTKSKSKH